jgi:superfamily II DNA/RNA helicase
VHRVGRAARAGRPGASITLLKPEQAGNFRFKVLARTRGAAVAPVKETLLTGTLEPYAARFSRVLEAVHGALERERSGKLLATKLLEPLLPLADLPSAESSCSPAWARDTTSGSHQARSDSDDSTGSGSDSDVSDSKSSSSSESSDSSSEDS